MSEEINNNQNLVVNGSKNVSQENSNGSLRTYLPNKGNCSVQPSHYIEPIRSQSLITGWNKSNSNGGVDLSRAKYVSPEKIEELKSSYISNLTTLDDIFNNVDNEDFKGVGGRVVYELDGELRISRTIGKISPSFE